jgi:DNA-binding transcriptional ArsR family regulator
MPGGRLTGEDRERIAAGLAQGLSHAEIGRRLGRPTSTVSREVTRNGGAAAYRADQAARATATRARRVRAPGQAAPGVGPAGRDPSAARFFEEWFTPALVAVGVPRMMARVMTCLFTADSGALTAAELARELQVSPASVSKAVSFLEEQGLLRRERDGRRERYVIDDDVWFQAWLASARSSAMLAEAARQGARMLGPATPAGVRLATMSDFLVLTGRDMMQAAEHWHAALYDSPPEPG